MKRFMSVEEAKKIAKKNEEARKALADFPYHVSRAAEMSREPFGEDLTQKVAERLLNGEVLKYVHRDYCGHGLSHDGSNYILATYLDGTLSSIVLQWNNRDDFVAFLREQSDFTMSGASPGIKELAATENFYLTNQTITRSRLVEFVSK